MKTPIGLLTSLGLSLAACCVSSVASAQAPVRIMALGDSITEGYVAPATITGGYRKELHSLLTAQGYVVDFVGTLNYPAAVSEGWQDGDHEAHRGFKIADIRSEVAFWLKKVPNPDVILLHIGTNDFWAGGTVATAQDHLTGLLADLTALRPHAKIIVSNLNPRTDLFEAIQDQFNDSLPGIVQAQAALGRKVTFVDMHDGLGTALADISSDGVHPSPSGYDKMATVWLPAITSVITPSGTTEPPAIASVDARADLTTVTVTFSKPIKDVDGNNPANFTVPGASVSAASLDASKRTVTLTTTSQTAGALYTLSVSGIHDRMVPENLIAPGTTAAFLSRAIVDGSFEQNATGWTQSGNVIVPGSTTPEASDGQKLVVFSDADTSNTGEISQTFSTLPGQKYRLRFDLGVYASNTSAQLLQLTVKDGVGGPADQDLLPLPPLGLNGIGASGNPLTKWQMRSFEFTAVSVSSTVAFEDVSAETSGIDLLLDDVRLEAVLNDAPVAVNDGAIGNPFITVTQDSGPSPPVAVLANDSDADGDPLTVIAAASPNGAVAVNGGQTLSFTPATGFSGNTTISYSISDGQGGTASATVWIAVAAVGPFGNGGFEEGSPVDDGVPAGWDVSGSVITYSNQGFYLTKSGNGNWMAVFNGGINEGSASLSQAFTTTIGQAYTVEFDVGLAAGQGIKMQVISAAVSGVLTPPGQTTSWPVSSTAEPAEWVEPGKNFTFTANSSTTTLTFTVDITAGALETQNVDLLLDNVRVTPSGGGNQPPVAVDDGGVGAPFATVTEDSAASSPIPVLANDSDPNLDPLTVTLASSPDGSVAINSGTTLSFTPTPNFNGATTISYTISDGLGGTSSATTFVEVTPVNDAPVAVSDTYSTPFNTVLNVSLPGVLVNDTDDGTAPLTAVVDSPPNSGGSLTLVGNGSFVYTPVSGFVGTESFTYHASDGSLSSSVVTVSIWVIPAGSVVNGSFENGSELFGAPQGWNALGVVTYADANNYIPAAGNGNWMAVFNPGSNEPAVSTLSQQFATVVGREYSVTFDAGLAGGVGPKSQILQAAVSSESNPPPARSWTLESSSPAATSGTKIFTFVAGSTSTTLTFTVDISAGGGAIDVDLVLDDVKVIPVGGSNQVPVAVNDGSVGSPFLTVAEDSGASVPIAVLANDTDADLDPLTVTLASSPNGAVVINSGTTLRFTPSANFNGTATISYTVSDVLGGTASATTFVAVTSVNDVPVAVNEGTIGSPFVTVGEDSGASAAISVLGNDTDVDLNPLTVTLASSPNGTVAISSGTTLSFTPALNFSGATTISYTISDGQGGTANAIVFVAVTPVNDPPVAVADGSAGSPFATIAEDSGTATPIAVLGNDTDVELNPLTMTLAGSPNGAVVINSGTTLSFTPAEHFHGATTISYTISDGQGGTASATVFVAVTPVNDVPVAVNDGSVVSPLVTVAEDSGASAPIPVLANDTDIDLDVLAVTLASSPHGAVTINSGTTLSFTPAEHFNGATTISYTISDGNGGTASATAFVAVTPVNDVPVAVNDGSVGSPYVAVAEDSGASALITVLANDTDADLDSLTVTAAGSPNGAVVISSGAALTFTPAEHFNGPTTISYTISDGNGGTASAAVFVSVTPVNDVPVAVNEGNAGFPFLTINEDSGVSAPIAVLTNDTDADFDALTVTLASSPNGTVAVNSGTTLSFTPALDFNGATTISYTLSDGQGGTASAMVFVAVTAVNDAPVAVNDGNGESAFVSVAEDSGPSAPIAVLGNDTDVESDLLTVSSAGSPNGAVAIDSGTTLSFTPAENFHGATTITYTISDGHGGTASATVFVTVTSVNDVPVAVNDGSAGSPFVTVDEDSGASSPIAVLGNDTDADPDTFAVTLASSPNGAVAINSGATLSFTPAENFSGGTTIAYTISDGQGGTASATAFVAVTPVNDAPVAVADGGVGSPFVTVVEDSGASALLAVLGNDTDVESNPLTITSAGSPNGAVAIDSGTTLGFTPAENFNGATTITYTISDGQGGTASGTVFVTVTPVNDAPVAVADGSAETPFVTLTEDSGASVPLAVLANDADTDSDLLSITSAVSPNGVVAINPAATLSFSPAENFNGLATISYTISDGQGGAASATVFVAVTPVNDLPVAVNDGGAGSPVLTVNEDSGVSAPIVVLGNDTDPDPDVLTVTLASSPDGAVVINSGTTLGFTPAENFNGATTISYTITDGQGGTASATAFVAVTPVNDAPVAVAGVAAVAEDTSVTINLIASDVDAGDALTYEVVSDPANGSVNIVGPVATYTPNPNYHGSDSFTFRAKDTGLLGSAETGVSITVNSVNDAPVANDQSVALNEDGSVAITLTGSDDDAPSLSFAVLGGPSHGSLRLNGAVATYTPDPDFNGLDSFYFIALTFSGGPPVSAVATVSITVNPVNDPPLAIAQSVSLNEDGTRDITLAGTDPDLSDVLSFTAGAPMHGSLTQNGAVVTYTPNPNYHGPDGFSFTAGDGTAVSPPVTVSIAVNSVNDLPVAVADGSVGSPFVTVDEDSAASLPIAVLANDSDADLDVLAVTLASSPNGTVAIRPDKTLAFTPALNFNGATTISYTISDGNGGTSGATVYLSVSPINDAPVAIAQTFSLNEDGSLNIMLSGSDLDADIPEENLIYSVTVDPLHGSLGGSGRNRVYTPNPNFNGADSFTFKVSDGGLDSLTSIIQITVNPVNDAPVAVNDGSAETPLLTVAEDSGILTPITVLGNDSDVDLDPLTVTLANSSEGVAAVNPDGSLGFTPALNFNGTATVSYTVSDGQGLTADGTVFVAVTPVNDPPVAVDDGNVGAPFVTVDEDSVSALISVLANDTDVDPDTLTVVSADSPNGVVTIDAGSTLSFAPASDFNGATTIFYTVSDGYGGTSGATVHVVVTPVNDPPVAVAAITTVNEDGSVNLTLTGSDVDAAEVLVFSKASDPANGSVTVVDGVATYIPNPNFNGSDSFTFKANDGDADSLPATVSVTVTPVDDPPVANAQSVSVGEDGSVMITLTGSDVDGDSLVFTVSTPPAHGNVITSGAIVTYTPDPDYSGSDTFDFYVITLPGGTPVFSVSAAVAIAVTPVSDTPVAVNEGSVESPFLTVAEDSGASAPIAVLANDTDVDLDPLTVILAGSPDGVVVVNPDGTLTFNPALNFNGATTISYTISDGNGGTADATVYLSVSPVNDVPVAIAQAVSLDEDGSLAITLSGSDPDGDITAEDLLYVVTNNPLHGTLGVSGRNLLYTPDANFTGADSLTFKVNDGTADSTTAVVSITVNPVNDPPTATAGTATVNEDGSVNITLTGSDVDAGEVLTFSKATDPANGSVSVLNGIATYIPNSNFKGSDSFTFMANDGDVNSIPATVSITVTPVDDAPVANPQSVSLNEDASLMITLTGSDVDGDTLFFTIPGKPPHGNLVLSGAVATYTPDPNYNGPDSISFFVYTIVSGNPVFSSSAAVSITVNPVNDTPVAVNDGSIGSPFVTVAEDSGATAPIAVLANDTDTDLTPLTVTLASSPDGMITINDGTTLSFTPAENFNGPTSITYTISDGQGGTASATVFVAVTSVNDAPLAIDDGSVGSPFVTVEEDSGASPVMAVLSNDADLELNPLTVTLASSANGTVVINSGTTLSFTPADNFNGATTISYAISDGQGGISSATVFVAVTPVNDLPVAVDDGSIESPFVTLAEDSGASAPIAVLGNDTDADPDALTVTLANSPNGTVTINAEATLGFTPAENFNGPTTISYDISDGHGGTASATVFVTVTPVNDLPVAFAQSVSVNEDTPVNITLTGSDIDGDTLTFAAGSAAHGTILLSGSVATYTPAANYSGPDTFTFTVSDAAAVSTPATISVNVIEVGGPAFDEWLTQYSLASVPGTDSDHDSISNAVEYVIGGNPATQPDTGLLPTVQLASADLDGNPGDEDYLLFTYRRTDLANEDPLTTIQVEWSTDLAGPWSGPGGMVEQVTDGAGVDLVKVYIPRSLATEGRLFTRLGVEISILPAPE